MNENREIIERLDRLEREIAPLTGGARAMNDLRMELAPRVGEAVQLLITELADIEADFQVEDLLFLFKKVLRNVRNLSFTLDQVENLIAFVENAEPLLKTTVPKAIYYLDDLEQKGVFHMLSLSLESLKKIGETYSQEDKQQIADGVVRLAGVAKKLTAPAALDFIERAADLPAGVDLSQSGPAGLFSLVGALGDSRVKEGMGVLLELSKGLALLKGGEEADGGRAEHRTP